MPAVGRGATRNPAVAPCRRALCAGGRSGPAAPQAARGLRHPPPAAARATAGVPFVLVEASDGVGGRVRTDEVEGFLLDRGFQIFLTSYPEAKVGLSQPGVACQGGLRGIFLN